MADYFTAMLFHRKRIEFVKDKVFEFSNSVMGRKLQAAEVNIFQNCLSVTWNREVPRNVADFALRAY